MKTSLAVRVITVLVGGTFALTMYGQIPIKTYTTATDTFYWKRYVNIPKPEKFRLNKIAEGGHRKEIDRFINMNLDDFPQFTNDSGSIKNVRDLRKSLYPVEINGDGKADMIFTGYSGGPSDLTRIYLNRGNHFELVFEDYQYLTAVKRKKGIMAFLQTGDIGTGDDYLYFTRDYEVRWEQATPVFIKGKQTVVSKYTEEPSVYFKTPVPFRSTADTLMVRASAAKLNEPFNPGMDTFGNIVARYRQNIRGEALAVKTLGNGNTWYYVEIFPGVVPAASILYHADKVPTFLRGWVSQQSILLDR